MIRHRIWAGLKWAASVLVISQAVGFVSFIWEECLQSQGFAVKAAMDARAYDVASDCLQRFHRTRLTASTWQHWCGWLCPWMHMSYLAYFDSAAVSQVQAYDAMLQARRFPTLPPVAPSATLRTALPQPLPRPAAQLSFTSLVWSAQAVPLYTNSAGIRSGHIAPATEEFWSAWRADKDAVRNAGYGCTKRTNAWFAVKFEQLTKGTK